MDDRVMVKKIGRIIKLTGVRKDGSPANSRQSREVVCYVTPNGKYKLHIFRPAAVDMLQLDGPGITELFTRDAKYGYFLGYIKNQKVNIVINKISGEIRFIDYVPGPYSLQLKRNQMYDENGFYR